MDVYTNRFTIAGLGAGASTTLPHTLEVEGEAVPPQIIWPDRATPIVVVSADADEITFRNDGAVAESATFEAKVVHTINSVLRPDFYWQGIGISGSDTRRYSPPEKWYQENVEAGQTDVDLSALVSVNFDTIKMIYPGSIVGLGTRFTETLTDVNADSAVVTVTINGVAGTLALSHSAGANPDGGEATQASGVDTFVAGDELGIQITTLATFLPVTSDIEAWLVIEQP